MFDVRRHNLLFFIYLLFSDRPRVLSYSNNIVSTRGTTEDKWIGQHTQKCNIF